MQTANCGAACCDFFFIFISQRIVDFFPSHTVRLIPVQLAKLTLPLVVAILSPVAGPVYSPESCEVTNLAAHRNGFDVGNLADNFEGHRSRLTAQFQPGGRPHCVVANHRVFVGTSLFQPG